MSAAAAISARLHELYLEGAGPDESVAVIEAEFSQDQMDDWIREEGPAIKRARADGRPYLRLVHDGAGFAG